MAEPKSTLHARALRRRHLLFVVVVAFSVLAGVVSTGDSSLFSGSKPSTNSSGSPNKSGTAALSATDAATTKAALFAAQQPSPIHGNTWVTPGSVPQGFQAGSSVELPGRDTATTTTFVNPDGSLTTKVYGTAVNFLGSDGTWHHIDPSLAGQSDGSAHNVAGPHDVRLGATLADPTVLRVTSGPDVLAWGAPLMAVQSQSGSTSADLIQTSHAIGVLSNGNTMTYPAAWPGVDLRYVSALHMVKEVIVLHAAPSGSGDVRFRFLLSATGVTPQSNADGSLTYVDSTGTVQFATPVGVMGDSKLDPLSGNSPSAPVTYSLGPNGTWVDVVASGSWLRDPSRVYPVSIDPSLRFDRGTDDAYVRSAYATTNFHGVADPGQPYPIPQDNNGVNGPSDNTDLIGQYKDNNTDTGENWTYLGYDFSSLNGTRINSATWWGYFDWTSDCGPSTYWMFRNTSGWSPTGVTWNTRPSYSSSDSKTGSVGANWQGCGGERRSWSNVDVTSWVQGWTNGSFPSNGFVITENGQSQSGVTPYWKKLASDETIIPGGHPEIDVTYEKYGPVNWGFADSAKNPPDFPQNGNPAFLGPTVSAAATMPVYVVNQGSNTWPANGNYRVAYHVLDAAGNPKFYDGHRTYFGADVVPGSGIWVNATVDSLYSEGLPEGSYILRWDMVDEGVAWFSSFGGGTTDFRILVAAPPAPTTTSNGGTSPANGSTLTTSTVPTLSAGYCGTSSSPTLCHDYLLQLSTDQNFNGYITSSGWFTPAPNTPPSWKPSTALQNVTTYYWRVMGRDQYSSSTGWSSPWSFTTGGTPAAPGTVTVGQTPTSSRAAPNATPCVPCQVSVNVAWTPPPTDGGSVITSYDVTPYLNWEPQPSVSVTAPLTSVTLSGLVGGGNYAFTVTAVNSIGAGVPSDFSATIVPSGVPGAPSDVKAQGGDNQVEVSWVPPPDSATDVTGYQVNTYLASASGTVPAYTTSVAANATSVVLTQGIVNGVAYTFGVVSVNSSGGFAVAPLTGPIMYSVDQATGGSTTTPTPSPTLGLSFNASTYARGSSALLNAFIQPTSGNGETGDTLTLTLPAGFDGTGSSVLIGGQSCGSGGVACTTTTAKITVTGLTVPAGGVNVSATLRALGIDVRCTVQTVTGVAANSANAGGNGSAQASVCDSGIGLQHWWSFAGTSVGPLGSAHVNVTNGNLVLAQTDSSVFQLHGHLKLGTQRTYNSEETAASAGEPLGKGWTTAWVSAGDVMGGTGLRIPSDEHVTQGQTIVLIDDTGARVVFTPNDLASPIDVTGLGATTGPLAPLLPTTLSLASGYTRLCIGTVYASEPGVHASMWRYLESSTGGCSGLTAANATVLGYATMTVDRVRREFDATGRLLSVRDASGNRVDYAYDGSGHLIRAAETGGSSRAFTLTYGTWSSGVEIDVRDPAGRTTRYQLDSGSNLANVLNPDGTALHYTYGGCGGSATQLCSATDPRGGSTAFTYAPAPLSIVPAGSPAQVSKFTDRVGTATAFTYKAADQTQIDTGGERQYYKKIDSAGRVGQLDEGAPGNGLRLTMYTWDTASATCRQPDAAVDNDLCAILRQSKNNNVTPNRSTQYTYNDEGAILVERKKGSPADIYTTSSYTAQYVEANGSVRSFHDAIAGGGQVTSGSTGRRDSTTLFDYSDRDGELSPNGNACVGCSNATYSRWQTLYTIDNNSGVGAGISIAAGALPCDHNGANTGLVCLTSAPGADNAGDKSQTTYAYDTYGQRTSMTTPNMNVFRYTYFQDGDVDLSGLTHAGGWLRAVTDPAGNFVAYGYDAAGNVVRTWERNATVGHGPTTSFPGTLSAPPSTAYSETLYASGAAAYSAPWRFLVSSRDALGNVTTYQRDANGNPLGVRPPRGNQGGVALPNCPSPATYDVCSTYDAGDRPLTMQQPVEATQSGSPHSINTYDQYGNLASRTDPDGNVTTYGYDSVNRQVLMSWTMGPTGGTMQTPPGCRASASTDAPIPANRIVCSRTTIYDGVDNVTATSDGAVANDGTGRTVYTVYGYDAFHRLIQTYAPRYDGVFRMLQTANTYDADGNLLATCPPREFSEGQHQPQWTTCQSGGYFSTYRTYNAADLLQLSISFLGYSPTAATEEDTLYTYDRDGNRTTVTFADANGKTTSGAFPAVTNTYNALDRLIAVTTPRDDYTTNTTSYTYDPSGNRILTSQPTSAGTRNTIVSYDADNRPVDTVTAATTTSGQPTTDMTLVGMTDPNGGTNIHTRVSYDADGHAIARFSPRAFSASATSPSAEFMVRTDYDADGRPTAQYVPRYDSADGSVSPLGVSTVWSAQASQASDCPTAAAPATVAGIPPYPSTTGVCVTRVQYDPTSRVTQQLMPTAAGNWSSPRAYTFAYTDNGFVYQRSGPNPSSDSAAPVTATTQYDVSGNVVSSTDPAGSTTVQNWSRDHLLLSTQYPLGAGGLTHTQAATYDASGNQISSVDGVGASTVMTYTTNNLKQSVATPSGGASLSGSPDYNPYVTSYTYDPVGNLLSTTSPNANAGDADNAGRVSTIYTYTYDNLLATTVSPPGPGGARREVDNTYDAAGQRLTQYTFQGSAAGGLLSYQYYLDGRLQQDTPRSTTPSTIPKTFKYNADGNITTWQEAGAGTSSYYIDGTLRSTDDGGYNSQWSYDGAGRMATLTTARDAGGQTATEAARYTNAGQTAELRTTLLNGGNVAETRNYDVLGRRTSVTQSNGDVATATFNTDNTLASVTLNQGSSSGPQLSQWAYTYDRDYRISFASQMAAGLSAPSSYSYTYYPDGRLQQYAQSDQGSDTAISYDHDGNRTGWTPVVASGAVTSTYNADDSLNQTSNNKGSTAVSYDAVGRMTSDTCTGYTYDGFDRMIQASPDTSPTRSAACGPAPTVSPTQTTYAYDALDRQGQHTDGTGWWWLHFANMSSEIGVLSVPATGAGEHDQMLTNDSSGTPSQVFDIQANVTQWFTNNGQGSLGDVTKSDGTNACVLSYDFYGASTFVQSSTNPCRSIGSQSTSNQLTELGYHYGQRDSNTGDYTFGSRTYDPSKAAFATPDTFTPGSTAQDVSIGSDPLTEDRYSYVNGDPVNRIDPTGHRYTTGDDTLDAQGSATCAVCFTQPTQYVTHTSHGTTCDASCRQAAAADRSRAVAVDQKHAAQREAARSAGCDGPHAGAYGCPGSGSSGPAADRQREMASLGSVRDLQTAMTLASDIGQQDPSFSLAFGVNASFELGVLGTGGAVSITDAILLHWNQDHLDIYKMVTIGGGLNLNPFGTSSKFQVNGAFAGVGPAVVAGSFQLPRRGEGVLTSTGKVAELDVGLVDRVFSISGSPQSADGSWSATYAGLPIPGFGLGAAGSTYEAETQIEYLAQYRP